jgi:hypothetical protein
MANRLRNPLVKTDKMPAHEESLDPEVWYRYIDRGLEWGLCLPAEQHAYLRRFDASRTENTKHTCTGPGLDGWSHKHTIRVESNEHQSEDPADPHDGNNNQIVRAPETNTSTFSILL